MGVIISTVCLKETYEKYIDKKELTTGDVKELAGIYARTGLIEDKKAIVQIVYRNCRRPGIELLANHLISARVINSKRIRDAVRYLYWIGQLKGIFQDIHNQNQRRRGRTPVNKVSAAGGPATQ